MVILTCNTSINRSKKSERKICSIFCSVVRVTLSHQRFSMKLHTFLQRQKVPSALIPTLQNLIFLNSTIPTLQNLIFLNSINSKINNVVKSLFCFLLSRNWTAPQAQMRYHPKSEIEITAPSIQLTKRLELMRFSDRNPNTILELSCVQFQKGKKLTKKQNNTL